MARIGSFIRSAAQDTFSAYRSVPVRWRLGGGSAGLTFVILAVFAFAIGTLTTRQISHQFTTQASDSVGTLAARLTGTHSAGALTCGSVNLHDFASADGDDAQIRVFDSQGQVVCTQALGPAGTGLQPLKPRFRRPHGDEPYDQFGYYVAPSPFTSHGQHYRVIYARPLSTLDDTIDWIRARLVIAVFGGAILALLAGLYVAQRAMRPISELTEAAREIERTRDPRLRIPHPEAEDEVAELARTLEGMLTALDAARTESETALMRQREFVADASHELRTPLTSVLANLELLADELDGEQADSANAALRSTRRMRRLVGDLLLLARADVERDQARLPTDLGGVLTDVAAEIGPMADSRRLVVDAHPAVVNGAVDDLHRMLLNLIENAVHHTPSGTHIRASARTIDGLPTVVIEDDGPGIPPTMQEHVFKRFVRGGGDAGARGTGLGLAIVEAVAESHAATVSLVSQPTIRGTRFTITFPVMPGDDVDVADGPTDLGSEARDAQTSTTTGSTIGRRRNLS